MEKIAYMRRLVFFHCIILFLLITVSVGFSQPQTTTVSDTCQKIQDKKLRKMYDEGFQAFKKGYYSDALVKMKALINAEPAFYEAYYVLGYINYKKSNSNFREAEKYFQKLISYCPDYDNNVYLFLGEISYGAEKYTETVKFLSHFLQDVDKVKSDKDYDRAESLLKYSKFYLEMTEHPVPFDPKVVEGVSTPDNEYLPIISPDNQIALYTREKKVGPERDMILQTTTKTKERFMFSTLQDNGSYSTGEEMPDPFNKNDNEGGATVSIDNNTLFYTVCKPDKAGGYNNCDIFYSEFVNEEWTPIRNLGNNVNKPDSWESQPSISPDENELYFVSDRAGGFGGYDIYYSKRQPDGSWGPSVNIGPVINTAGNEKAPFLHPDGKTLYFSSDGQMGLGGYDIFFSRRNEKGEWSKPKNLGYPINSPDNEVGFFVSTDGETGYFSSNKYRGKGGYDLYSFPLYAEARPDKVLFLKGTIRSGTSIEPIKAHIELKNLGTKQVSEIPLDTMTGKYVAVAPFNNDYIMTVKKEGAVYESRYIAKADSTFSTPAKVDMDLKPIQLNTSYRINDIYFDVNSAELNDASKVVLDQLIQWLSENMNIAIQIQGHTDNIGNDIANLKLSENRAKAVFNYLITNGIA
ncbi:MAG: OmpA family protein, partial [Syntrophothermus sp.]